jgi:3-phosphoshikimate 1-carboxyvinyltransferase
MEKELMDINIKIILLLMPENSGTLGRLILGFLINTTKPINLIGDKSLSSRDFKRISDPLSKFGGIFN